MSKFIPTIIPRQAQSQIAGFIVFLVWLSSIFIIPKIGISWDEKVQRDLGKINYEFITDNNPELLTYKDRHYGVAIELPLYYLESVFKIVDSRDIYLFRHYFTFGIYCLAAFTFFLIASKSSKHRTTPWIALILFLLCPRILGHAFYNTKDIPFLAFQVFSLYALLRAVLLDEFNLRWTILFGVFTGILINIRILGVATLAVGSVAILGQIFIKKEHKKWYYLPLYIAVSILCTYITWPYLWSDPINRFLESYELMSQFPWDGTTRLWGKNIPSNQDTAYYLYEWLKISIPIISLGAIVIGTLFLPAILSNKAHSWQFALCMLALSGGIIFLVCYQNNVIYDDWRHLYFVWPALLWPAILLYDTLQFSGKKSVIIGSRLLILTHIFLVVRSLYSLYPYYYIYFNEFVSKKENYAIQQFEGDYWGLSYLEGIKYILATDPSDKIKIMTFTQSSEPSFLMLTEEEKKRAINIHDVNEAHYILTIFRFHSLESNFTPEFNQLYYEIRRNGGPILRIWRK